MLSRKLRRHDKKAMTSLALTQSQDSRLLLVGKKKTGREKGENVEEGQEEMKYKNVYVL